MGSAWASGGVPAGARLAPAVRSESENLTAELPVVPQAAVNTVAPMAPLPMPPLPSAAAVDAGYKLGVGDKLRVTVYGEPDLSGEYEVSSTGTVALPLVGEVPALNMGLHEFERSAEARLAQGYLQNPRVSAQITNYRPFFILGEVAKPGSYPYVNGMTILNAVALAGGYTYRADRHDVRVTHAADPNKKEGNIEEDAVVKPGDIIRVPERFF